MIWGCFRSNKLGPFQFIDGHVKGIKYKELLEKSLLPFHQSNDIFQDD